MPQLNVILEALEPLLLGDGPANANVQTSQRYVAGSAWRGATAGAALSATGKHLHNGRTVADPTPDPAFTNLFLGERAARFGFLYPLRARADAAGAIEALPIPLTARTCKQHGGFAPEGHGVFDGLLNRLRRCAGAADEIGGLGACPICRQRLERLRGFMRRTTGAPNDYAEVEIDARSFVRVGLNRYTETAQDQILYVLDALVPDKAPISFLGGWWGDAAQQRDLMQLLDEHLLPDGDGYRLAIGAARARGMGQARLRLTPAAPPATPLEQRVDRAQPQLAGRPIDPQHVYATLTLRAPLLLLDAHGLPAPRVTGDMLRAYHSAAPPDLQLLPEASVVEREPAGGWSSAWGLPKPLLPAFSAGGVLALRAPAAQRDRLLSYLAALEERGLGERTAEGWGETLVCDPFHTTHDEGR